MAEIDILEPQVYPNLVKTAATEKNDKAKKSAQGAHMYKTNTFKVSKAKEIFNILIKEGKVKLSKWYVILTKEEINGKEYYKYQIS